MKNITRILICNVNLVQYNIVRFYINASKLKYTNTYTFNNVIKDVESVYQDRNLFPTNKIIPEWFNAGFDVARNKRGWAFAYKIVEDTLYIYDAENCRNLTMDYNNTTPFVLVSQIQNSDKQCFSINYKVSACRKEDGYIYLFKDNQRLPGYRFNEIIKPFYKYKSGEIYAIGSYGGKKFKITLDGIVSALNEMKLRRFIKQVIAEVLNRRFELLVS